MSITDYRDLVAWQKAMDLVEAVYRMTRCFPKEELFALTAQIRRAAISVASNIAEGQGRRSTRDFLNFLSIANGSLKEVETQVLIAGRLGYVGDEAQHALSLAAETGRLCHGLANSLRKRDPRH